jgi:hypothetical protein
LKKLLFKEKKETMMAIQQLTWKQYLDVTSKKAQQEQQTYLLIERSGFVHTEYTEKEWEHRSIAEEGRILATIYASPIEHKGEVVATYQVREGIEWIHDTKIITLYPQTEKEGAK